LKRSKSKLMNKLKNLISQRQRSPVKKKPGELKKKKKRLLGKLRKRSVHVKKRLPVRKNLSQ